MGNAVRWTPDQLDAYTRRLAGIVAAAPIQIAPLAPKAHRPAKARSPLEVEMERQLREAGVPFVAEFKPLPDRKFRLDFAILEHRVGIECEGAVHRIKSRWSAFPERHHLLSQAGWRMVYVGRAQIMSGEALTWVRECMRGHRAQRDELARMRHRIECLRGALKSASGRFLDTGDNASADNCLEWAGDMEPPLPGPNAEVTGGTLAARPVD